MSVGFIGAGKMAKALLKSFVESGKTSVSSTFISCPKKDAYLLEDFKNIGVNVSFCNKYIAQQSDIVIIATKPGIVPLVLKDIKDELKDSKTIVSIAAGVTINQIETNVSKKLKVVRAMPNSPSIIRSGVTVYSLGINCKDDKTSQVIENLFSSIGSCYQVPEDNIDAVTGISGSGPAYMFMIIEAMADAGVKQGLPRDLSYRLAAQTMVGSGKMVLETGLHPGVLKDEVCSPSGTTIEAVRSLEKNNIRFTMMDAVEAAAKKSTSLGKKGYSNEE